MRNAHLTLGIVTVRKIVKPLAPRVNAASSSAVPCCCMSGISSRATNGTVTKSVASTMPGTAKMIRTPCAVEPLAEQTLRAKQQNEDKTRHDRRHGERKIDQGYEGAFAPEAELRHAPSRREPEGRIDRHNDRRDRQGKRDRGARVRIAKCCKIAAKSLRESFDGDNGERREQE